MKKKSQNQLRVAILGHKRMPSREGGVEVVVTELAVRLAERGCAVTCYNRRGHHVSGREFDSVKLKEYRGVRIERVLTLDVKGLAAMTSSFFASLRAAFGRYDVVHYHAEGPCAMLWLPRLFGKRCIATIHGLDHKNAKWGRFASWYIRLGERVAAKRADELIVLSRSIRDYFMQTYGRETVYIPNGVSPAEPRAARLITEQLGLDGGDYILYVGRLVPEKGIDRLIEAFGRVDTDKKLIIAGGVSDSDAFAAELRRLADGDGRVRFVGFVQGQLLEELYSNAYVYVLPSELEGMPLSLLEAMSYSNCCLVSDIPECTEVTGDRAVRFRRGDTDDLAEKLQALCDDAALVLRYKEQSASFICQRYSWDDVADRTLRLYRGEE